MLTAAHCFNEDITIYVGAYDTNNLNVLPADQKFNPGDYRVYAHPDYDPCSDEHDQMIMKLNRAVASIDPVKLDLDGTITSLTKGDPLQAIGWGDTETGNSVPIACVIGFLPGRVRSRVPFPYMYDDSG